MDELNRLLDQAEKNLAGARNKEEDVFAEIDAIPKLQTGLKLDAGGAKERKVKAVPVKAMPTTFKPVKPETAGKDWFDLGKPEMTPELKRDLQLLKMRHALDPKRFYKKENAPMSEYFAVGTLKEDASEFYSARISRKNRKKTLAEEILASKPEYFKSRYQKIQDSKRSGRKKHLKNIRNMRA